MRKQHPERRRRRYAGMEKWPECRGTLLQRDGQETPRCDIREARRMPMYSKARTQYKRQLWIASAQSVRKAASARLLRKRQRGARQRTTLAYPSPSCKCLARSPPNCMRRASPRVTAKLAKEMRGPATARL